MLFYAIGLNQNGVVLVVVVIVELVLAIYYFLLRLTNKNSLVNALYSFNLSLSLRISAIGVLIYPFCYLSSFPSIYLPPPPPLRLLPISNCFLSLLVYLESEE